MTITLADPSGYVALESFGLDAEALVSLASLAEIWPLALREACGPESDDPALAEFMAISQGLVCSLGEAGWQQSWLRAWHKLHGRGFSQADTLTFFFHVLGGCERLLLGDAEQVGRLTVALFSILRRAVFAVLSSAIELGEEVLGADSDIPGELAALGCLREMSATGETIAVLSLALSNRNHFAHLAASDLQNLPGLLATQLRRLLRPSDKIFTGREGEWLLLLPGVRSMAQPTLACAHICRQFSVPLNLLSGRSMQLDASIGAALAPDHGGDAESILHAARLARWDLSTKRESFGWFQPVMRQDWQRRFEMSEELHQALHYETLTLFLQPQVDAASGECTGAELLLRWQRNNGEWVPPPVVIAMIGDNGWRDLFTDWLIRSALHFATELTAAGIDISLSLNLTAADLLDADLPEMFAQRLETWQMPASRFTLELTESAMLEDPVRCLDIMRQLRALGFRLAIDDFGTGYSSLSYLVSLPVNEIKIDRSFVMAMASSQDHLRIVRTIIDLAWDLEMMPLAEGVDDPAQVERLRQLGCHRMQGYLYAQPMPLPQFIAWYQSRLT